MRLHEMMEKTASLAEAMGLPFAAGEIREYIRQSEDGEIRFFRTRVPTESHKRWQLFWGWPQNAERLEGGGEFIWRVPEAIVVGPEF